MEGLSKTQQKKILKRERIQEKYRKQKEAKKSNQQGDANVQISTKIDDGIRPIRQERNAMFRADFESQCEGGPVLVIDCDWGDKMTDKETLSLTQQIMYSYSVIKNSKRPVRLWIVGASEKQRKLIKKLPGSDSWYVFITNKTLAELGQETKSAIYLTADAEDVLNIETVDSDSMLVIGGIVDRNRHKNATLYKAEELGMRTAQLPIGEFMQLKTSKVLTVNHVVEILVHALHDNDWNGAIQRVIPDRKRDEADSDPS
jgi:tRNA (guanine9-N1)-methyltransferase